MKNIGGDTPQIVRNPEGRGIKRLFYSVRDIALIKDKMVAPGYGVLYAGTVMSVNSSTAGGKGTLVPYVPVYNKLTFGTESAIGVSPIVADGVSGSVKVSLADSYKYQVGDELVAENNLGEGPLALGAITSITRTDARFATIACSAYTATNITVAKNAYIYVEAGASDPWSTAAFIIDKDIDTGVGEEAAGAQTSVVISNAVLYTSSLVNATSEALTAIGGIIDGQHIILK